MKEIFNRRKAAAVLRVAGKRAWLYRRSGVVYILASLINITLSILVLRVAYQSPHFPKTYGFNFYIVYFTFVMLFSQLTSSLAGYTISETHIKLGGLSQYLLKPYPYLLMMLLSDIPWRILQLIFSLPFAVAFAYLNKAEFAITAGQLLSGICLLVLAYIVSYLLQVFFSMFTFWFDDVHGIMTVFEVLILLFSGMAYPLFLFPTPLFMIARALPFSYLQFFPVMLFLGKLNIPEIAVSMVIPIFWIAVLALVSRELWHSGLRKFTGEGI